jgi:hypothetical protein
MHVGQGYKASLLKQRKVVDFDIYLIKGLIDKL